MINKNHFRLASIALALAPVTSSAVLLYAEDFDAWGQAQFITPTGTGGVVNSGPGFKENAASPSGWRVWEPVNGETTNALQVVDGTGGGFGPRGYLATGDGVDYAYAHYTTANSPAPMGISYQFVNMTSDLLGGLSVTFDLETLWNRFDGSTQTRIGGYQLFRSAVGLPANYDIFDGSPFTNAQVGGMTLTPNSTPYAATTWYTDAYQDTFDFSIRNMTINLPGQLAPGQSLTLQWIPNFTSNQVKNVAFGVDNFSLSGVVIPEPSTYIAIGGFLALGAFIWRRRRKEAQAEEA